jgi:hypothetical protein
MKKKRNEKNKKMDIIRGAAKLQSMATLGEIAVGAV